MKARIAAVIVIAIAALLFLALRRGGSEEDGHRPGTLSRMNPSDAKRADDSTFVPSKSGDLASSPREDHAPEDRGSTTSLDGGAAPLQRERLLDRAAAAWESMQSAGTSTSVHPITATGIRTAVQASKPKLQECYEGWLAQNPKIAGRLKIGFTIVVDPENPALGKVTKVELEESDVGHVFMEGCILATFADLKFEAPPDGTLRVAYPLSFANEEP